MKTPFRSLLVVSMSLIVLLGLSGCGSSGTESWTSSTTKFAYIQEEASAGASGTHADLLPTRPFSHAVRTHKAGKRATTSTGVDIQTGSFDLYVYDTSTNTNTQLVTGYAFISAQLSNDGTELLVCAEDTSGYLQLYLADAKFQTINQLTSGESTHFTPSISPDGTFVIYSDGDYLYSIPIKDGAAAGAATEITAASAFFGIYPVVAPDNNTIVFTGEVGDTGVFIYSLNLTTQALTKLSLGSGSSYGDWFPAISPDGKKVAFTRVSDVSDTLSWNIASIDITGETTADPATALTSNSVSLESQYVAGKIVFMSENTTDRYLNIWEMNTDGSNQVRLTNESEPEFFDEVLFGE
jgi:Tol biopolymer transport system component